MNKDQVLEKSRKENKVQDEMERDVYAQAGKLAAKIGGLVCGILLLLESFLSDSVNFGHWVVYCSIYGTMWIFVAVKLKKKSDYIFGGVMLLCGIVFFITYLRAMIG